MPLGGEARCSLYALLERPLTVALEFCGTCPANLSFASDGDPACQ